MLFQEKAEALIKQIYKQEIILASDVKWLCETAANIFLSEPTIVEVNSPAIVVGDVHAQLISVMHIFKEYGSPENNKYVFLGDYVDRGPKSLAVIALLLAFKIKLGNSFVMIRGNHEEIKVSSQYQFRDEVLRTYKDPNLMICFDDLFKSIPLGALINNSIICIHGGIGPAVRSIDSIREIKRPFILTDQDVMYDLCWADPQIGIEDWGNGKRATSCSFGVKPLLEFFERSKIKGMIRGHEVVQEGFLYSFGEDVNFVTLFSAPGYAGQSNKAAVLKIDENGKYHFLQFEKFNNNEFDTFDFTCWRTSS